MARGFEGQGVGGALHTALSEHARGLGKTELQLEVGEEDGGAIAFLEKRGYREVERQKAVALELGPLEPPPIEAPTGVEIQSWEERPDLLPAMFELYREANADIPGLDAEAEMSFEDWRVRELERPARRHDLSFVAVAGDELVGLATLDIFPAGGFHGLTAVARAWRRHGVGRALKRAQIAAAKAAGLERLYTESEERNEPMRRLNEQLGFPADSRHGGHAWAPRFLGEAGALGYNLPSGGDLVSTWSVLRKSCKPRSPVGLVKQPGTT